MVDSLSPSERSERMSRIRSRDTKPELVLRKLLHGAGFRFRLCVSDLPGRPDIILPKFRTAIFVQGCFWHRHPRCKVASSPKSNTKFWVEKFKANVRRDRRNCRQLRELGWRVFIVWECQLRSTQKAMHAMKRLVSRLVVPRGGRGIV